MSALLFEPYRKHPSTPMDLSWVDRSKPKPAVDAGEAAAREALVRLGGGDLLGMLFDPIRSSGRPPRKKVQR